MNDDFKKAVEKIVVEREREIGYILQNTNACEGVIQELLKYLKAKNNDAVENVLNSDKESGVVALAIKNRYGIDVVRALIECGADIQRVCSVGRWGAYDPVTAAVRNNEPEILEYLFSQGAKIPSESWDPKNGSLEEINLLFEALRSPQMVKILLQNGADPNSLCDGLSEYDGMCHNEEYPIIFFSRNKVVTELLVEYGAEVDVEGPNGRSVLNIEMNAATMKKVLQSDIDIRECDKDWNTVLHSQKDVETIKVVLEKTNAPVNQKNYFGQFPLDMHKDLDVLRLLVASGADVNVYNEYFQSPLHNSEDPNVVDFFISAGANVNARDNKGNTPLHLATNLNVVQILVANGAQMHLLNHSEETPLDSIKKNFTNHISYERKHWAGGNKEKKESFEKSIEYLSQFDISKDLSKNNKLGKFVAKNDVKNVEKLLLKNADANTSFNGKTLLEIVLDNSNVNYQMLDLFMLHKIDTKQLMKTVLNRIHREDTVDVIKYLSTKIDLCSYRGFGGGTYLSDCVTIKNKAVVNFKESICEALISCGVIPNARDLQCCPNNTFRILFRRAMKNKQNTEVQQILINKSPMLQ